MRQPDWGNPTSNQFRMTKAIIFDIDGTLYESRHFPLKLIFADPLHIGMLARERRCRKRLQGRYFSERNGYYDALFRAMSANPEKSSKWFYESYMPAQVEIIKKSMPKRAHLKELMAYLKGKGVKIAVLSDYAMAVEKLSACGLEPSDFDAVWESPDLGGLKPCREVFLKACMELGTEPSQTLMIGDKFSTDGGAMAVGMPFIRIIRPASSEEDLSRNVSQTATDACGEVQNKVPYQQLTWDELCEYLGFTSQQAKDF
ncbi:MAG: HAD family hydrolase [Candidatus Cryptobacteroides sp.]